MNKRILTGLKPSGDLHLGNYFGAIKQIVDSQNSDNEIFIFIADWHAMTTVEDADTLSKNILDITRVYLACGIDPDRVTLYRQSDIPAIPELSWILACQAPMGLIERAHSYKDHVAKKKEVNCGLFTYPILMAADILIVDTDIVPVGKDQKQHVEIARDLAKKFNHNFGETLTLPQPQIKSDIATIIGTDGQKMSKSYGNVLPILGTPEQITKLCKRIKTDSKLPDEPKNPDEVIPYQLLKLINPDKAAEILPLVRDGGMGYGDMKNILAEEMIKFTEPFRANAEKYTDQDIKNILAEGAKKARTITQEKITQIRKATGLN